MSDLQTAIYSDHINSIMENIRERKSPDTYIDSTAESSTEYDMEYNIVCDTGCNDPVAEPQFIPDSAQVTSPAFIAVSPPIRELYERKKVLRAARPKIHSEVSRLERTFKDWAPNVSKSERNKIDLNDGQLMAIWYAQRAHVSGAQIAKTLDISNARASELITESKKLYESRTGSKQKSYTTHVKQTLNLSNDSPRI